MEELPGTFRKTVFSFGSSVRGCRRTVRTRGWVEEGIVVLNK